MKLLLKSFLSFFMKDKFQTILLFISILISSCFIGTIISSMFSLQGEDKFMSDNQIQYNYQFNYISTAYEENNISTISPFFAFSNATISDSDRDYAIVNLGQSESALLNLEQNEIESSIVWGGNINFSLFKFDNFSNNNYEQVRKGRIGNFFNFNFDGSEFKQSLIGKLYEKYSLKDSNYNEEQSKVATSILQYFKDILHSNVFANVESFILEYLQNSGVTAKNSESEIAKKICDALNFKDSSITLTTKKDLIANGFNGTLGRLINGERKYNDNQKYSVNYDVEDKKVFFIGDEIETSINHESYWDNTLMRPLPVPNIQIDHVNNYQAIYNSINQGTFEVRKTVYTDFYAISSSKNDNRKNRDFLNTYLSLLSNLSNFQISYREQAIAWNNNINGSTNKFKIINGEDVAANNELRVFQKDSNLWKDGMFENDIVMITPMYAKINGLKIGDTLKLGNNQEFQIGAIGGDSENIYPLIYDTDVIPDQSNEALIYVNSFDFNQLFSSSLTTTSDSSFAADQFQDVSTVLMSYTSRDDNEVKGFDQFRTYFADNPKKLSDISNKISKNKTATNDTVAKFKSLENNMTHYLRTSLLTKSTFIWTLTNLVIGAVFIVLSVYILSKSIKKIILNNKHTLGILKAGGFSTLKISGSYPIIVMIFAPFITLFGSLLSFGLIKVTSNVFTSYFVIRNFVLFDWKSILIVLFSVSTLLLIVAFLSAFLTLKVKPLNLINDNEMEKNSFLTKWVDRVKIKGFQNRLGLKIGVRALPSIRLFLFMTFIAMFAISITATIPFALNDGDKKYYENESWNVETKYQQPVTNNPIAMLGEYQYEGYDGEQHLDYPISEVALIPRYVELDNQIYDTYQNAAILNGVPDKTITFDEALKNNNDTIYSYMEHSIIDNFLQLKSLNLSLGILKTFVDAYPSEQTLRQQIVYLVSSIIPKVFNQKEIDYPYLNDEDGYYKNLKYCLEKITNSILPALVKETWFTNEKNVDTFVLGVGSIPVDPVNEEAFSWVEGVNGDNIYGINENSKFVKGLDSFEENEKVIPVLANTKYILKNNVNIGSMINEKIETQELALNIGTKENPKYISIHNEDWMYKGKQITKLENFNLANLVATLANYSYKTASGEDYTDLTNVSLMINKNDLEGYDDKNHFFDSSKSWCIDHDDKWEIKLFDYGYDEKNDITDITGLKNAPINWATQAENKSLLSTITVKKQLQLKIIGVQKTYDQPRLYTKKSILNNALGIGIPDNYFNGKFSLNKNNFEETKKYVLFDNEGIYSISNFSSLKSAIKSTDYIYLKKAILNQLSNSLTLILLVPTIFIIVFSIIIITLAINWMLQQFKKVIALFKVIGYKNSEILGILLKLFIPPILIGWIIGNLAIHLILIAVANKVLSIIDIPITIAFNYMIIFAPLIVISILFISIFTISYNKTRKMHIQEILEI